MLRGTVTFVPEKIRQKIMMRHFYTCSFPARSPVSGTTCLPEVGFLTLTDKTKLWLLGLLEDCLFDFIFAAVISFQFWIGDHKLRKNVPPFFHTLLSLLVLGDLLLPLL
jgi:hypothetical protein